MMRLRRLARMGLSEIAGRARQEASRWLERRGMVPLGRSPLRPGDPARPPIELADPEELRSLLPGAADPASARTILGRFPDGAEWTIHQADRLLSGRFDLMRHRDLFFGDPIDWHLDPVNGRRARMVHWSRLAPLDPVPGGDPKVIWELNRHQWMVTLGQAWRLTGDSRYAEAVAGAMRGWLKANPPGWGINWASSLEVALRLISWGWALALLRTARVMTPELQRLVAGAMAVHARHVERNLSRYFSPNTHLTGEALGLSHAAAFLPRLPRSRVWKKLSDRILREELGRQVLPDGVYFEQSTCYQRYTIEFYLHYLLLLRRTGAEEPPEAAGRIQSMLDFLLALCDDRGTAPQIGDGDSGRLMMLPSGPPEEVRSLFAAAASLFHRPDYAWAAGGEPCPEVVWLLGPEGLAAFDSIVPSPPARSASCLFPDGGYAVLGEGWESGAPRMVVDVGHLGSPAGPGHGHADALSVQCWAHGEPYLADPGTYCYTTEPHWRDHFRSAGAHSTLLVDGRGAASPAGPFSWGDLPVVRLRGWRSDPILDVVDAEHEGFRGLEDPVVHRRRVAFVKPGYWVIVDDLSGAGPHQLELRFQLHPDRRLTLLPAQWAVATGSRGRGLLLRCFATIPLSTQLHCGELAPPHGWFSPGFGRRVPAPVLVWSSLARLPARLITLVMPALDVTARPPHVSPLINEGPRLVGLVLGDGEEFVMVNDTDIHLERRDASCAASRAS